MPRNLKVHNNQRLQTSQLAASVPISNPSQSRSKDSLQIPKRGTTTRRGVAVPSPVQGFQVNSFDSRTEGNSRLGTGITIRYPAARVVPALRDRMVGGHPVISRTANTLSKPGGK